MAYPSQKSSRPVPTADKERPPFPFSGQTVLLDDATAGTVFHGAGGVFLHRRLVRPDAVVAQIIVHDSASLFSLPPCRVRPKAPIWCPGFSSTYSMASLSRRSPRVVHRVLLCPGLQATITYQSHRSEPRHTGNTMMQTAANTVRPATHRWSNTTENRHPARNPVRVSLHN